MTRYCIRNPSDRSAVYTVAYIGEEELRVNFFPIFLLQSIQLICLAVLNGVSGIIDPQQIQNNIRADLTDTDNFEAYALGIAFAIQKTELADLFCFRCWHLPVTADTGIRSGCAGNHGYYGEN